MILKITLLVLLLAITAVSFSTYKKFTVDDPDAFCLDGTKPAYYIKEGDSSKWVINFEGGGWCGSPLGVSQTIEDCYQRSKTDLGSSKAYGDSFNYQDGMFGDSPDNVFKDWTIVYVKYCTGTGHQGYRKEPIQYKDTELYFRGHNSTEGMMKSLVQKNNFNNVEQIVITGQSAGGLATYVWTEYIVAFAKKLIVFDLWSIPDSGIFLDQTNQNTKKNDYKQIFLNFMQLSNSEVDPPNSACVRANPSQKWKCMFAEYNYKYINIPLFAIQSPYDTWSLPNILGLYCEKDGSLAACQKQGVLNIIEDYHQNTSKVLRQISKNPKNGYWAPSCANHCYVFSDTFYNSNYRIPAQSEYSLSKSIADWINNVPSSHIHQDAGNWPSNGPCSGLKQNEYKLLVS